MVKSLVHRSVQEQIQRRRQSGNQGQVSDQISNRAFRSLYSQSSLLLMRLMMAESAEKFLTSDIIVFALQDNLEEKKRAYPKEVWHIVAHR